VISDALRRDITRGVYGPGDSLHTRELAERFGVSAMPVREALRRLEAEGLVSFDRNRRITVNVLTRDELVEVTLIRQQLEPLAMREAVPRLAEEPATVDSLGQMITAMDDSSDPDAWRTVNEEFHRTIYSAAQRPRLEAIIASLMSSIEPYIRLYVRTPAHMQHAQVEHRQLLEYIRADDPDGAAKVLVGHIAYARDRVMEALDPVDQPDETASSSAE
jgi:DNA-binding GntR family transcriptional regulator